MAHSSPAFAFPDRNEPQVLSAAGEVQRLIAAGETVSRAHLNRVLNRQFGESDADGRWSVRDAHAVLELAQVLWLRDSAGLPLGSSVREADAVFAQLETLLPSQTVRSQEQIELQQFATPPRIAWLLARACALQGGETVLEPSAGTGMLAVWAANANARLILNEISPLRRDCLGCLFPDAAVTGHDGELIDELLDPSQVPTAVLVNPPYSHGVERGHDGHTGARHLRSAWKRLAAGGRLAAIIPEWFDVHRFLEGAQAPITLRLNVAVERGFVKHGTSITTRLVVLDKAEDRTAPVIARTSDFDALCDLVDAIPARLMPLPARPATLLPVRAPIRLPGLATRPRPLQPKAPATVTSSKPCAYAALDAPAPIAEQVGHYLPYRPSRIVIPGAVEHPTPLVESVAMGSITAPIPSEVPQLPAGVISKGLLSAAQAETLIYAVTAHARDLPGRFVVQDKGCSLAPSAGGAAWDKLPSDHVRVSRICAGDGRSLLGREIPLHCVPELCRALGLEVGHNLSADETMQAVLTAGRSIQLAGPEQITLKRSLVNGSQRLELTGWSAARLDWYKAHGCFTEIIRYQTRLFVPRAEGVAIISRLESKRR